MSSIDCSTILFDKSRQISFPFFFVFGITLPEDHSHLAGELVGRNIFYCKGQCSRLLHCAHRLLLDFKKKGEKSEVQSRTEEKKRNYIMNFCLNHALFSVHLIDSEIRKQFSDFRTQ